MSDATKYMNTFVDVSMGILHENLNTLVQLKTQLKIANDLVQEKEQVIGNLTQELSNSKKENQNVIELQDKARIWEDSYNAMKSKVSHMDTLLKQISDMKNDIVQLRDVISNKDGEISSLKEEINTLKIKPVSISKSKINTKDKSSTKTPTIEKPADNILTILKKRDDLDKGIENTDDF